MFNWSKERIGVPGVLKNLVKSYRNGSDSKLGEGINLVKHWQRLHQHTQRGFSPRKYLTNRSFLVELCLKLRYDQKWSLFEFLPVP